MLKMLCVCLNYITSRNGGRWLSSSLLLILSTYSWATLGTDWLTTQANTDGSYASPTDIATPFQATSEVLKTFQLRNITQQADVTAALQFLNSETYHNTENLARKIIVFASSNQNVSSLVAELVAMQNEDGGFGELFGYHSSVLDTAFALQALSTVDFSDDILISNAINYLERQQDSNGGFGLGLPNNSSVNITAQVSIALQPYVFSYSTGDIVNRASDYLYAEQLTTGGWATIWETAQALLAVIPTTSDSTLYVSALNVVMNGQLLNGSWNNDVFISALAERALFLAAGAVLPSDPTTGTIKAKIINQSGIALAGVNINVAGATSTQIVVTNVDGTFEISNLPAESYNVSVSIAGYLPVSQTVAVQAGDLIDLGTFQLVPFTNQGVLQGIITDSDTGMPITGATVTLSGSTTLIISTDALGRYSAAITPGDITAMITASGYNQVSGAATINAGQTMIFSPAITPVGSTFPATTVDLSGLVIDSVTKLPIESATIQLGGASSALATSSILGQFTFTAIQAGATTIEISVPGYISTTLALLTSAGSVVQLEAIQLDLLVLPSTSTITGTVTDETTGLPMSGALVTVDGANLSVTTDSNGQYSISGILTQQFSILVRATGYLSNYQSVSLSSPGVTTVNIILRQAAVNALVIDGLWTDQLVYGAYETVSITAAIRNGGDTARTVKMLLDVKDAASQLVQGLYIEQDGTLSAPAESYNILPASSFDISARWLTRQLSSGSYTITLKVFDEFTNALLAERVTTVTIQPVNQIDNANLQTTPAFTNVGAIEQLNIRLNTINKSNADTTFTISYSLSSPGGTLIVNGEQVITLSPETVTQSTILEDLPVTFTESGEYNATFTVLSGTIPIEQSNSVIVVAPSLRVEASQEISPTQVVPDGDKRIRIQIQLRGVEMP